MDNTRRCLELLGRHDTRATCFVLGWVAHRFPALVREIAAAGHEIACHSYAHQLVYRLTPRQFREDTAKAVAVISDACGIVPRCYRAPSYSITKQSLWALETLVELGFTHDSSIYPILHDRYGIPGFPRRAHEIETAAGPIVEVPPATVGLTSQRATPVGGGGYLRMLPYCYTAAGIRCLNRDEGQPACLYFHPWEMDPNLPRIAHGWVARVRTYLGLGGMETKMDRLLEEFRFSTLVSVHPA